MCGFVGFTAVDFDEGVNRAIVKDMADRIIHRGLMMRAFRKR